MILIVLGVLVGSSKLLFCYGRKRFHNKVKPRRILKGMGQIRISPDEMRGRASEYRAEGEKLEDIIGTMANLLENLQGEWEGAASESYAARYTELEPGFKQARDLIEEIAVALEDVATKMEETDNSISSSFQG